MAAAAPEGPTVALSFANNFWGKEDAGVGPLLERMHNAKQSCDELRTFYSTRAAIEDEYARKLLSLCRKPLGSQETGTLRTALDVVRGEVESMAKQHQSIAAQMKSELEEPLAAFSGGMKERRKIVQGGVEKLLKVKIQQTQLVNKTRDRFEQECLKIKGYLAQGHMVMGQEERKNKAKLEKTQISVATSNTEYEAAVKALEETTSRWNREWKSASDKFQDLEEERLDFTKSSLWAFANIASTVCVSDDASCEKIRLSLEKMEVEKDIVSFIKDRGTGQEIPDPPKYINFCRGDVDSQSEASEDESYSVAQFPRNINPAFRSSSPQPSTLESHHDPNSTLARDMGHAGPGTPLSRETTVTPQKLPAQAAPADRQRPGAPGGGYQGARPNAMDYDASEFAPVPHDPYPMDGMTMLCRTRPMSELSSQPASVRPSSRDSHSDYSAPTSFSSQDPSSGCASPTKQEPLAQASQPAASPEKKLLKKKSGFFQNHSPFRRKSTKDVQPQLGASNNRNTWHPVSNDNLSRPHLYGRGVESTGSLLVLPDHRSVSPDPIDANASLALNVGQNVFPVAASDRQARSAAAQRPSDDDPIAQALAELKGVTSGVVSKQSSVRVSADHYHGLATPAPGAQQPQFSRSVPPGSSAAAAMRGTPPPSYDQQPPQRLGVPAQAVTSRAMKETSQKFAEQTRNMFSPHGGGGNRPGSRAGYGGAPSPSRPSTRGGPNDMPRAVSPAPPRGGASSRQDLGYRSASPNPYGGSGGGSTRGGGGYQGGGSAAPNRSSDRGYYRQSNNSPSDGADDYHGHGSYARGASPAPYRGDMPRSGSGGHDMAVQLSPTGGGFDDGNMHGSGSGSQRGRAGGGGGRPGTSSGARHAGTMSFYDGGGGGSRQRSKSVADPNRQFTREGRPIMHLARAMYVYQAAIPEELGFSKGDVLAVLRHQDDGWWEAQIHSSPGGGAGNGQVGLVPSNYLQAC